MTRTARSTHPRALQKDRSESRTGMDSSIRKNGGGAHNWGSLSNERQLESAALEDENVEFEELGRDQDVVEDQVIKSSVSRSSSNSVSDDNIEEARKFRKNALHKKDVDLSAIARTSVAASTSPPTTGFIRRNSNDLNKQVPVSTTTTI